VHIRQQGHSIHIFNGKFEIKKDFDNMVIMTGVEDVILLNFKGTSSHAHNSSYLFDHDEGTFPYILLCNARFGHINYDNLCLLKKNGVSGFPTIPRKLKQCDACILGKHRKQPFHDSTSIECGKLGLKHYDLCGLVPIPLANGNKYIMYFIDDYTRMRWVYLLKDKSHAFETFKYFHLWIQNEAQSHIDTIHTDIGREYTSNGFENYLCRHGIKHQTIVPYNPQ
jgi:hypothetical protein